jgi:GNAT superfamily N-acetyltransferase
LKVLFDVNVPKGIILHLPHHEVVTAQASFEAFVARIAADFSDNYEPVRERCWIAEREGESLGCVFLVKHRELPDTAQLRMLLVTHAGRGIGLGKALERSVRGSPARQATGESCSGPTAF